MDRIPAATVRDVDGLVGAAVASLSAAGQHVVAEGAIVDLADRAVFRADLDGRCVVVKTDADADRLRREIAALAMCRGRLPVPDVLHQLSGPPAVCVLSVVPGQELQAASAAHLWRRAGAVLARVHAVPVPADTVLRPQPDWAGYSSLVDRLPAGLRAGWTVATLARVRAMVTAGPPGGTVHRTFLHGDCQPAHFLTEHGEITGLIDFGDAALGDPVWDLAVLTVHSPEKLPAVLEGYAPSAQLRNRIAATVTTYWLVRLLLETIWLTDRGYGIDVQLDRLRGLGA